MNYRVLRIKDPGPEYSLALEEHSGTSVSDDEVRVKMTSIGLNRADLLYPQNRYFFKPQANSGIGFEGAGEVVETGANSRFSVGDKVSLLPMSVDPNIHGCIAEYGTFKSNQLFLSPNLENDIKQGAIWMAYLTAWGGLNHAGQLAKDQNVLVTAASSSVGIASIQIAKQIGANVLATTTSESKFDTLYQQGADKVLLQPRGPEDYEQFEQSIEKFTQAKGINLSFDAVAGPAIRCLVKSATKGGRIVVQGMLDRRPMDIHAGVLMKRSLNIVGYTLDDTLAEGRLKDRAIKEISDCLNSGEFEPLIHKTYGLEEYQTAFDDLAKNQHIGKLVITP